MNQFRSDKTLREEASGLPEISLDEINAEIFAVRAERKTKRFCNGSGCRCYSREQRVKQPSTGRLRCACMGMQSQENESISLKKCVIK